MMLVYVASRSFAGVGALESKVIYGEVECDTLERLLQELLTCLK